MSHSIFKTQYFESGNYGSVIEKTVYADYDNSCDIVTFYDNDGDTLLTVEDTLDNNILQAMFRIFHADDKYVTKITKNELDQILNKI